MVMTRAATRVHHPADPADPVGHPVALTCSTSAEEAEIGHIRLADEADLVVVAPATADAIARLAAGMADDLLAAVVLASRAPMLLAPAMNVNMWENPLTQANLRRLLATGRVTTVGPDAGELACGWIGAGPAGRAGRDRRRGRAEPCWPRDPRCAGRQAGGGHRRADPRGGRRRALPGQPLVGEDGLCAGRRRGRAWAPRSP